LRAVAALALALACSVGGAAARPAPPSYAQPSWSPDGTRLVFARALGPAGAVVTAGADGKHIRRLSKTGALSQVSLSPDGRRIAYVSRGRAFVMQSSGKGRHAVGSGADFAWSRDGEELAFAGSAVGGPIQVVRADGSGRRRVTSGRFDHAPAWSPEGRRLAFTRSARVGGADFLYVVAADGTGLQRLGPQGASPAWSPDGARLAFWQRTAEGVVLAVYNFAGPRVVTLTRTFAAFSRAPRWSPDATRLLLTVCGAFGQCRVDVAAADGSGVARLLPGSDPAWSPDGARFAFVTRRLCAASSVFVANADGSRLRRITACR
jgi:Tol biopolymer transport system component